MLYVPFTPKSPWRLKNLEKQISLITNFSSRQLRVAITVRSPKHEKILRRDWDEAQKTGIDWSKVVFEKT